MLREVTTDLLVLERALAPGGEHVVDIGCGGGALLRELEARGARVVGVEVSEEQLASAVARDARGHARYLVGRAQDLPLADASVDVVIFMRTLHHVPPEDLMQALGEARRVLRADGAVYVAEPQAARQGVHPATRAQFERVGVALCTRSTSMAPHHSHRAQADREARGTVDVRSSPERPYGFRPDPIRTEPANLIPRSSRTPAAAPDCRARSAIASRSAGCIPARATARGPAS